MDAGRKANRSTCCALVISAWNGQAGKMFYLAFWLPLLSTLWAICFALAWRAYPSPGYQMPNHDISFLGHPALNPKGWWFWSTGMGIAAVMMFPPIAHACRRMEELTRRQPQAGQRLVSLGSLCLRGSCFGLMGLALAPQGETFDLVHKTAGVFAFGGMYLTLLILWSAPLFRVREISAVRWTLFAASAWWGVVGFLSTQGYRFLVYGELGRQLKSRTESVCLRFSLWEWMLFAAVTTSFVTLISLLPGRSQETE